MVVVLCVVVVVAVVVCVCGSGGGGGCSFVTKFDANTLKSVTSRL